ncbi:fimbria/pilus outer membrane usher protein [Comamonas sp. C24C]
MSLILEVRVNGTVEPTSRPVLLVGSRLLFSASDVNTWRIVPPTELATRIDGTDYYDLAAIPNSTVTLDDSTQVVNVQLPIQALMPNTLTAGHAAPPMPSQATFGAFLNYDLALQHTPTGTHTTGLVDAAVSDDWGLAASSFLIGRSSVGGSFGDSHGATRLDTYYRMDDPVRLTRLTLGDSISQRASWSTPFRFGGVQFGTQFALQPGYISYPTPTLHGGSALPSTIEAYVNDTLRYQGRVNAGPFALNSVPMLTGAGDISFVVRDAMGVQRTVTTPYYVSSSLLRADLSSYSVEFGWTRLNYGLTSFDYGRPFTVGTWRHGLSDSATVEVHGEANTASQIAGAGLNWVWTPMGEFGLYGAASRGDAGTGTGTNNGNGTLWRASFAHIAPKWSFSASRQAASRNFTQIAWQDERRSASTEQQLIQGTSSHLVTQDQVFVGRSLGHFGSVGASYTALRYITDEKVRVLSLNWSKAVTRNAYLSTYVARSETNSGRVNSAGLTLTIALGERLTGSLGLQRQNGRNSYTADVTQIPPPDRGAGWRVQTARGDINSTQGQWDWREPWGTVGAQVVDLQGQTSTRLLASGALGYAGGLTFATQRSGDAFALVTVPNAPGTRVYRENQPVAKTDENGRAIVSGLRAWEVNQISIDNEDLSIAARVGSDTLQVVPRAKGVAAVRFDISQTRSGMATVRLPDGRPLPPGIDLTSTARETPLISGFDGAVQIDQPRTGERFEARWRDGTCSFVVGDVPAQGTFPQLGSYTCR